MLITNNTFAFNAKIDEPLDFYEEINNTIKNKALNHKKILFFFPASFG
ncbi:hypothetical protein GKAS_00205 [Kluyvera ascorbata ATCC 33433]|nr:hypothetical protein GKAS_00205 [Kluyvera ascorbata ATCC 33433]